MALINGSNGIPVTTNKPVAQPATPTPKPVKEVIQEPTPKVEVTEEQPRVTKVVNSKKKKN